MSKNRETKYCYQILRSEVHKAGQVPASEGLNPNAKAIASPFQAEAHAILANRSDKSSRFLDAALSNGPEFEPVGRLAGYHPEMDKASQDTMEELARQAQELGIGY